MQMTQSPGTAFAGKLFFSICLLAAILSSGAALSAQDRTSVPEAWEPDSLIGTPVFPGTELSEQALVSEIASNLIRFYQAKVNPNSVSRCPFYISCSNFALLAIEKYGFLPGILLFIDRIYYRENPHAAFYYPKRRNYQNYLKLDDSFFLYGSNDHH